MDAPWKDPELASSFAQEFLAVEDFARKSLRPSGFGYLLADGKVDKERPVELWITCRMTHVFSIAHLLGVPGAYDFAQHGVRALTKAFVDPDNGGWVPALEHGVSPFGQGKILGDGKKEAYAHAFVILAGSSAAIADIPGGRELLETALADQSEHWWEPEYGRVRESWDRAYTQTEDYRGLNSNMHTVEALLSAYSATGERIWLDRARSIMSWVAELAVNYGGCLPEHFSSDWQVEAEYNVDRKSDPFRPYGATPGHAFEWARLILHLRSTLREIGDEVPDWTLDVPRLLFNRACEDGWDRDLGGFVYTTSFEGEPIVTTRMHWVLCEAVGAAIVLGNELECAELEDEALHVANRCATWIAWADQILRVEPGRWLHEVDEYGDPSATTWGGMPDAYHVAQMLLLPSLPSAPGFAKAASLAPGIFTSNSE